ARRGCSDFTADTIAPCYARRPTRGQSPSCRTHNPPDVFKTPHTTTPLRARVSRLRSASVPHEARHGNANFHRRGGPKRRVAMTSRLPARGGELIVDGCQKPRVRFLTRHQPNLGFKLQVS